MTILKTRLKLIFLLFFSTLLVILPNPYLIFGVTIIILLISLLKISLVKMKNRLIALFLITLMIIMFQLLFGFAPSLKLRLMQGLMISMRFLTLSLSVFLFTETTSVSDIVSTLSFLPQKLNLMITISFALIPVILKEMSAIRVAQQSRGLQLKGFRSVFPILIPLLGRTLGRAEHIAIVLQTRGFAD